MPLLPRGASCVPPLLVMVAMLAGPTCVQAQGLSAVPGAFVDMGIGPRATAMGYAGAAASGGLESVAWNPANSVELGRMEAAFSYLDQFGLVSFGQAAVGFSLGENWGVAASASESGDEALKESILGLAVGRRIGPLALGARGSLLLARFGRNDLSGSDYAVFDADEIAAGLAAQVRGDAAGFALDVGLRLGNERAAVGVVVRNAVAPVTWNSTAASLRRSYSESLPLEVVVGTQFPAGSRALITMDFRPAYDSELDHRFRAGAEFTLAGILALRAGTERSLNGRDDERYTVGFGVLPSITQDVRVGAGYAFATGPLGGTQQFSLQIRLP